MWALLCGDLVVFLGSPQNCSPCIGETFPFRAVTLKWTLFHFFLGIKTILTRWNIQLVHNCDGKAVYTWGFQLRALCSEPGIHVTWELSQVELFRLILYFSFCLRGKSWKFQAPAVIHVSPFLTAYALTSIRPRPGTIFWRKPYSRKTVLTLSFFHYAHPFGQLPSLPDLH